MYFVITTEVLISLVEIGWMLMPSLQHLERTAGPHLHVAAHADTG
jgi:hypothetical protein